MVFDEATNETVKTEVPPVAEPVIDPVETTEDKPVEPGTEKPVEAAEEVKTEEPAKEEDNSVIRNMRKQFKVQQKRIAELERAIQQPELPPQRENFETDAEYIDAQVDHRLKVQQAATQQAPILQDEFEEASKNHPDFNEALSSISHVKFNPDLLNDTISDLDYGSEVLYHIAKNVKLAEELATLKPVAFAARLGEIHSDIKREKTKKPKPSSAPAPIKPVAPSATPQKNYDEMSMEEFNATRLKERRAHKLRFS